MCDYVQPMESVFFASGWETVDNALEQLIWDLRGRSDQQEIRD